MKIILTPNKDKTGFSVPSEYNKKVIADWVKTYKQFTLEPVVNESYKKRRYLEGAVIPAYCHWQYGIDPRDARKDEARRLLFKKDFHFEIGEDRAGNPVKIPTSSKGMAGQILEVFTRYAEENGCPIPNADLYKIWRDKWRIDIRFPTFFEFLDFLELQVDSMPSDTTLARLGEEKHIEYPANKLQAPKF
jgi:hypothetical protein